MNARIERIQRMTDDDMEASGLVLELIAMALDDPLRETVDAACFLGAGQRARSREIGKRLDEIGGMNLMLAAHESVFQFLRTVSPSASAIVRGLEMSWHEIGDWRD